MREIMSYREIADELNAEGLRNVNGKLWDKKKVNDFARRLIPNARSQL